MEEAAAAAGGLTYLVVPAESDEYRLEVAADEPVRVRVVRDPREQALLEGRAHSALGTLSIGVSARVTFLRHLDLEVEPGVSRLVREAYDIPAQPTVASDGRTVNRLTAGLHAHYWALVCTSAHY